MKKPDMPSAPEGHYWKVVDSGSMGMVRVELKAFLRNRLVSTFYACAVNENIVEAANKLLFEFEAEKNKKTVIGTYR